MSDEQLRCQSCGAPMAPGERACPECGEPYGSDHDTNVLPRSDLPPRAGRPARATRAAPATGALAAVAPYKTILLLVGVLVLIVAVGYMLFSVAMLFFQGSRPAPAGETPPVTAPAPGQPPLVGATGSPVVGAAPSPAAGTVIGPAASPSPSPGASGVRLKVTNTEGQGANMRQRASTTAPILRTLPDG